MSKSLDRGMQAMVRKWYQTTCPQYLNLFKIWTKSTDKNLSYWLEMKCYQTDGQTSKERHNTVDSRHLKFQGTLWNTSKISEPRHIRFAELRKKLFEQPHLTNIYVIGLLKLGIYVYWKYCGKEEKLLLRSSFSSFPQYFLPVVRCHV